MSLAHVAAVAVLGAGAGIVIAIRSIRSGTPASQVALWSGASLGLAVAFAFWLLLGTAILGDPTLFLLPDFWPRAERRFLMLYCFISGALTAFATAGIAHVTTRAGKA